MTVALKHIIEICRVLVNKGHINVSGIQGIDIDENATKAFNKLSYDINRIDIYPDLFEIVKELATRHIGIVAMNVETIRLFDGENGHEFIPKETFDNLREESRESNHETGNNYSLIIAYVVDENNETVLGVYKVEETVDGEKQCHIYWQEPLNIACFEMIYAACEKNM